jgi:ribosomal protein L11 methylase PrmA
MNRMDKHEFKMPVDQLKNVETHFAFGENWASYAEQIEEGRIEEAKKGLLKLIPATDFKGKSFLDIGCGSGLSALAAAQLGVKRIVAVDIDPVRVWTHNLSQ